MWITIVILLSGVGSSLGKVWLNETTVGNGVIISRQKDIKIIKGELLVSIPLKDFQLYDMISELERKLGNTSLNKWQFWHGMHALTSCAQVTGDWKRFKNIEKGESRKRRGLLNLGGEILQKLFGVSTERQVKNLEDNMGRRIGLHTVAIEKLTRLSELQTEMYTKIIVNVKNFANETQGALFKMGKLLVLEEMSVWCTIYNTLRIDLELGHVNHHLIDIKMLTGKLDEYRTKWRLETINLTDELEFEKAVKTRVVRLRDGDRVAVISIPFFEKGEFRSYRFNPFPMRLEGTESKIAVDIEHQGLILDTSQRLFISVDKDYSKQCTRQYQGVLLCQNRMFFSIRNAGEDQCKLNILLYKNYTFCDYKMYKLSKVAAIEVESTLFLSAEPEEIVTLGCHEKTRVEKLTEAGIGIFPAHCSIHSLHVDYTPKWHKAIKVTGYGGEIKIPHLMIKKTDDILSSETRRLNETKKLLEDLTKLQQPTDFWPTYEGTLKSGWVWLAAGMLIMGILVIVTGWILYNCKKPGRTPSMLWSRTPTDGVRYTEMATLAPVAEVTPTTTPLVRSGASRTSAPTTAPREQSEGRPITLTSPAMDIVIEQ